MLLKDAGHNVTILEAQNRLGGRILTYRGFAGDMHAEFGAMRFPRQHHLAQYLIEDRFKLETKPFSMHDDDTLIYRNGKAVRRKDFRSDMFTYKLSPDETDKTPDQILRSAVQPLIDIMENEDHDTAWERLLKEYDGYSLIRYLKERGISHGALSLIGPLLNLESRYYFSLVEWFSHYYENVFGNLVYIVDGADSLPRAFEPYLMDNIKLGSKVHAIDHKERGTKVVVHYRTAGGEQSITADECIITVPLGILRHMEIGGLDPDKWWAIRNSYYGIAHKIFMQFSERWWESKYQITQGTTVTDLAIRNIVYTPAGQDRRFSKGVIIASYCWEQDSIPYNPFPEEERIAEALQDLVKIHPEARDTFEFGISKSWSMDRYAGGIGPLFRPYEMSGELYRNVIRPVNRIWFANDACDRRHRRWIEGALKAAAKNAYALHTGMRNEIPWKD